MSPEAHATEHAGTVKKHTQVMSPAALVCVCVCVCVCGCVCVCVCVFEFSVTHNQACDELFRINHSFIILQMLNALGGIFFFKQF